MPKVNEGMTQANFLLPADLEKMVVEHQHKERLKNKTAAYIDLLERGLSQAKEEAPPK